MIKNDSVAAKLIFTFHPSKHYHPSFLSPSTHSLFIFSSSSIYSLSLPSTLFLFHLLPSFLLTQEVRNTN